MKIRLQVLIVGLFFLATIMARAMNDPVSLNQTFQLLSSWREHNPASWLSIEETNEQRKLAHFEFLNYEEKGSYTWRIFVRGLAPGNRYQILLAPAAGGEDFLAYFLNLKVYIKWPLDSDEANTRIWSVLTKKHLNLAELESLTQCLYVTNNGSEKQLVLRWNEDLWHSSAHTNRDATFAKIFALTFGADGRPLKIDETTVSDGQTNFTGGVITLVSTNAMDIVAHVPHVAGFVRDDEVALSAAFQTEARATPTHKFGYLIAGLVFSAGGISLVFIKRGRMDKISPKAKRGLLWVLLTVFVMLTIPPLQIIFVAFVNPPVTVPIILRQTSGIVDKNLSPLHYQWISINEMPRDFLKCVWIAEDGKFFEHRGFDWEEIKNAKKQAVSTGKQIRGASTISQQCARSLFLWTDRSWLRKGVEVYYTVWLELILKKRRILELYVNSIEFGDGVYGLEAGAQHFFGVPARDLTREQSALLVGVMPRPDRRDPNNPNDLVIRRKTVALERILNLSIPLEVWNSCRLSRLDTLGNVDKSGFINNHLSLPETGPLAVLPAKSDANLKEVAQQMTNNISTARTINLEPYVNCALTNSFVPKKATNNNLMELPVGVHTFGGIPFLVTGRIQLWGTGLAFFGVSFTNKVSEIAIGSKFENIHLFHGALFANRNGIKIAALVLHYKDGSKKEIEIIAGQQVLDWWGVTSAAGDSSKGLASGSKLAWVGSNPYIRERHPEDSILLYRSTFKNPNPSVEVLSVDYVSAETSTAPFLLGLTIE